MAKQKILLATIVLLLIVNIATLTFLWMQYKQPAGAPSGMAARDFIVKEVGLTPLQQQQYDSLRKIHRKSVRWLNDENRRLHDQMFENVGSTSIDSIMLDSMAYKLSQNEVKRQKATLYHFRELRKILTVEQQSKFDNILKEALKIIGRPERPRDRNKMHPPRNNGERPAEDKPPRGEDGPPPHGDEGSPPQ